MVDMPTSLILAFNPVGSQSPDRVNLRIPLLGEAEQIAEHRQRGLRVVLAELCKVGVRLESAFHTRNGET